MSAPELSVAGADVGIELTQCAADIIEISARRGRALELATVARGLGWSLPALGRCSTTADALVLSTRPDRWLILIPRGKADATLDRWQTDFAGLSAVIDHSSALAVSHLAGNAVRHMLARGCRLDLHPAVLHAGCAAATVVAQIAVSLVVLPASLLLLTPATTARHFHEWLLATARPFGVAQPSALNLPEILGSYGS